MFRGTQPVCFGLPLLLFVTLHAQEKVDSSRHTVQRVSVEQGVSLEVLDWGGTGRPLVLLTGMADNAHTFDDFAPKLTGNYHVYGITRRGRGISSYPEAKAANYSASRLGEDVLTVIDTLHLNKPVLAGHSIAGEELSYIGSHHPEKVAGLIYMDAGYPYALYRASGVLQLDAIELRKQLYQFMTGYRMEPVQDYEGLIANLERVEKEVKEQQQETQGLPPTPVSPRMTPEFFAMMEAEERFTTIHAPALVIVADEDVSSASGDDPQSRANAVRQALQRRDKEQQVAAFAQQVPSAHVVRIPHANHYVYRSNEVEVLREINTFISLLSLAN